MLLILSLLLKIINSILRQFLIRKIKRLFIIKDQLIKELVCIGVKQSTIIWSSDPSAIVGFCNQVSNCIPLEIIPFLALFSLFLLVDDIAPLFGGKLDVVGDDVLADVEIGIVEVIWDVPSEGEEFLTLDDDCVEPAEAPDEFLELRHFVFFEFDSFFFWSIGVVVLKFDCCVVKPLHSFFNSLRRFSRYNYALLEQRNWELIMWLRRYKQPIMRINIHFILLFAILLLRLHHTLQLLHILN